MNEKEIENLCTLVSENNDEKAFSLLFDYFSPGLLSYINTIVHRQSIAEELLADIFINLWKNRKMLHTIRSLSYYLYTSGKNISINYLKNVGNKKYQSLDNFDENISFTYTTPETTRIDAENLAALIKAIKTLPPKCQLIFRLSKEEHLTHKEIARLLDITTKTVENQITIALKKIVEVLRNDLPQLKYRYKGMDK